MTENLMEEYDNMKLSARFLGWGSIAALGEFLDAFAIVAWSVALVYLDPYYKIPTVLAGLVPAIFGYSWATTAFGGGHISDLIGRKRLYMWDLIIFIIGSALMVISSFMNYNIVVLIGGYALVGIGVGLDIPASEALVAEISPRRHRGKMMSLVNIWWYIGPITALLIALVSPTNLVGFQILFTFAIGFAILTMILRLLLIESPRYLALKGEVQKLDKELEEALGVSKKNVVPAPVEKLRNYKWKDLFMPGLAGFTIFIMFMNVLWAVPASTFGIYLPYIAADIGKTGFVGGVVMDLIWFLTSIAGILVYWIYADKPNKTVNRKNMFIVSSIMVAIGFVMFGIIPLKDGIVGVLGVAIVGFFQGFGMWPIIWLWGTERFPTSIRAAGRGFLSGTDRYVNYSWTFAFPAILLVLGLRYVAYILAIMAIVMAISAVFFAPKGGESQSLEQIESEISSSRK